MKRRDLGVIALAGAWTASRAARSQTPWATRPIRLIVPFAAGGTADVLARIMAERLTPRWGQQVVVENRPGAGGNIGAEVVARAAGDGHTLLLGTIGIHAASAIYANLPYSPSTDLAPITVLADMPNAIIVHPSVPARTLQELIAFARQKPGELTFGSAGNGSSTHLAGELFLLSTGLRMTHVPYRGSAAALNDLAAGNIQVMFENVPTVPPLAQANVVRVLAVTSSERVSVLDVPAAQEAGAPGYVATAWMTLAAPASVPAPLLERLNADARAVLADPAVRARFASLGAIPVGGTVEESRRFFAAETTKWNAVISAADIRVN
ncbi:Bug family tripartite tricarboxylate transporter substrate binding protein [Plastoroseomonas hellenica]|uniref:Tripartite tricarboxylate transporter substrate binding protein n=1 Tax=Plastoroseomonas hellenica TaxID=2687306 RepID=A0ABS5F329_9PROT|nr:tripartite tricarboxylate transporter substrate binding protein [Plastoroseomonas hellenica]MBR0646032.1 tripartite tricarboxylate transporter substrate binding protein [Plastoroseomonas hellenica]MBR0666878.1 tripartite tricarboxylate transporter substrate binding protein [Plastoroseomonas hellenica]